MMSARRSEDPGYHTRYVAEGACDGSNGLGVPFKDKFDKTLKLYLLMTTKPEEVEARKQKEMEE